MTTERFLIWRQTGLSTVAKFVFNPKLIEYLKRSPQLLEVMKVQAEAAAARTEEIAPVGHSKAGEHYKDMIEADFGIDGGVVTGRVNAKKFTSHFIEFGTIHNRAYAVLRRAAESLGLKFVAR